MAAATQVITGTNTDSPTPRPPDWTPRVNAVTTRKEQSRWDMSLSCSQPFGDDDWTGQTAKLLGLEQTVRGEGGGQYPERRVEAKY